MFRTRTETSNLSLLQAIHSAKALLAHSNSMPASRISELKKPIAEYLGLEDQSLVTYQHISQVSQMNPLLVLPPSKIWYPWLSLLNIYTQNFMLLEALLSQFLILLLSTQFSFLEGLEIFMGVDFRILLLSSGNKTRTSKVGAISNAQKVQNIFLKKLDFFLSENVAEKCKRGDLFGFINITFCCKISKNSKGGPFEDIKKFSEKSHSAEKNRKGFVRFCRLP